MGIFGNTSPFDPDVEKATSENNTSEEWGLIMEICDKGGSSTTNAKDCLRSIIKRLASPDPHVVVQAVTLLDACVNNCGKLFHLEIASRDFETEYRKLLLKAQPPVAQKLKGLLKRWAEGEFKTDPQLNLIPSLLGKLRSEGVEFSDISDMPSRKKELSRASSAAPAAAQKEEEDLARAIELSLQESKQSSPRNSAGATAAKSLYPSMNQAPAPAPAAPEAKKVRALYDFEAVEDNELTFLTGEIFHVIDSSDPNWWKGYNQRGEGLFPANFVTFDLTEPQPKAESSQRKVQFSEAVSVSASGPPGEEEQVEVDEGKIDRLLSLLNEANPEDAASDTMEMIQLENEVYRMGPLIDQTLEKADKQHAQLTQLSADLVDALNLYHTLMREPPPPTGIMKPPFPQTSHFAPPQMFNGTTSYQSIPSMNPYFSHIQQPAPVSMGAVSSAGVPVNMMGIPQQSMGMMMMPPQQMGPASLGSMAHQQQPPAPAGQQAPMPPHSTPQHMHPQATPSQHYIHQQPSYGPVSAGVPQSVPPAATSQGYVM